MKDNSIKAGELRLNNYIMYDGVARQITAIREDEIDFFNDKDKCTWTVKLSKCEPIPLTKEVLEKVKGCELISESPYRATWDVEYGGGRYITIVNHKSAKTWEVTFGNTIELQTPFLHTLQNVVYFNWGKELEITL